MEAAAWGLIGTAVGALSSIGTNWLSNRTTYRIASAKQAAERQERAREFQRQTLLDLQQAIHDSMRLVMRAHVEDCRRYRDTQAWGREQISEEVNEGLRLSRSKVAILVERLQNDELRLAVKSLIYDSGKTALAESKHAAELHLNDLTSQVTSVLERVGAEFRAHC